MKKKFSFRIGVVLALVLCFMFALFSCGPDSSDSLPPTDYIFYFTASNGARADGWWDRVLEAKNSESLPANTFSYHFGNFLFGTDLAYATKGESSLAVLRAAGYRGAVPGIKDLGIGASSLRALAEKSRVPFLASNVADQTGKLIFENDYQIVEANGKRVGVFGLIDPEFANELPENSDVKFLSPEESVERIKSAFTREKTSINLVLLEAKSLSFVERICALGIPLVAYSGCEGGDKDAMGAATYLNVAASDEVVRALVQYNDARTAYRIDATRFTPAEGEQSAVAAELIKQRAFASSILNTPIASLIALEGGGKGESDLGKLALLALTWELGGGVGYLPDSAVKGSIAENGATPSALFAALPCSARAVSIKVTGAQLKAWITYSVIAESDFAGIGYRKGDEMIIVNGLALEEEREYSLFWLEGYAPPIAGGKLETVCLIDAISHYCEAIEADAIGMAVKERTLLE